MKINHKIKFRVWIKRHKYFVYPEGVGYMNFMIGIDGTIFQISGDANWPQTENDVVVQQFTGIFDKNKNEIYEGDIVKIEDQIYEIKWGIDVSENAGIKWHDGLISGFNLGTDSEEGCEVIGNIFENPELLK